MKRILQDNVKIVTAIAVTVGLLLFTFIVAQRIGTIKDADKIIVVEAGDVVGMGKHEELLSSCEVYREIALSQLSKEELGQ